jgi:hypothetical protein
MAAMTRTTSITKASGWFILVEASEKHEGTGTE